MSENSKRGKQAEQHHQKHGAETFLEGKSECIKRTFVPSPGASAGYSGVPETIIPLDDTSLSGGLVEGEVAKRTFP